MVVALLIPIMLGNSSISLLVNRLVFITHCVAASIQICFTSIFLNFIEVVFKEVVVVDVVCRMPFFGRHVVVSV